MKTISILSTKGEVGSSCIAMNLAAYLAKIGENVCIIDFGLQRPSLNTYFQKNPKMNWFNGYLLGEYELMTCLEDFSKTLKVPGKLLVGLAKPRTFDQKLDIPECIKYLEQTEELTPDFKLKFRKILEDYSSFHQKESIKYLQRLIILKKVISQKPHNIDYLIIHLKTNKLNDHSSVNVMLTTDVNIFVVKLNDLLETFQAIPASSGQIKRRVLLLINLVPQKIFENRNIFLDFINKQVNQIGDDIVKFLGFIPLDSQLQKDEIIRILNTWQGKIHKKPFSILKDPQLLFSTSLQTLFLKLQ